MIYNPNFPFNQQMNSQFQNPQIPMARNYLNPQETIFIPVHSDAEVVNHLVAPGNTVYFKHETEPRIYIKSMGISQFDTPKITRYKLVEEPMDSANNVAQEELKEEPKYVLFDDLKPTLDEIDRLQKEITELKEQIKNKEVIEKPQSTSTTTKTTKQSAKEK